MLFFMVLKTHTNNNKTTLGEGPVNKNTRLHSFFLQNKFPSVCKHLICCLYRKSFVSHFSLQLLIRPVQKHAKVLL